MTDIILNLKEVVLKAASAKNYTVRIDKEGPGPVFGRDISLVDGLQVLNPDHLIATLDKKGPLAMELSIGVGLMVLMGFLAGVMPALGAMRLRITDALRRN